MKRPVRILIVEDDPDQRKCLAIVLESAAPHRYEIVGVLGSGEEVVQEVEGLRPDVVLMDIRLKGRMRGIEAAAHLRLHSDVAIVFMSVDFSFDTLELLKGVDPDGYIVKPYRREVLLGTIDRVTAGRMKRDQ